MLSISIALYLDVSLNPAPITILEESPGSVLYRPRITVLSSPASFKPVPTAIELSPVRFKLLPIATVLLPLVMVLFCPITNDLRLELMVLLFPIIEELSNVFVPVTSERVLSFPAIKEFAPYKILSLPMAVELPPTLSVGCPTTFLSPKA